MKLTIRYFILLILGFYAADYGASKRVLFYANPWVKLFFQDTPETHAQFVRLNRDHCRLPWFKLEQALKQCGYQPEEVRSLSGLGDFHRLICYDPSVDDLAALRRLPKDKMILFVWEPPTVKPFNYCKNLHDCFSKVFTLMDDLVDNKKYFKFYEPQPSFEYVGDCVPFEQRKLCTMLVGNKFSSWPGELYSARRAWVDFFEKKVHETGFDFYGIRWTGAYRNFKGFAASKLDVYRKYQFCICYENLGTMRGYITGEKILFPMICGCVPVYLGAPNITDYVPAQCFIDARRFATYQDVYQHIKNMPKEQWLAYQEHIKNYLKTAVAFKFSWQVFVDILLKEVVENYNRAVLFDEGEIALLG